MIISENNKPTLHDFKNLMHCTDIFLNNDAKEKQEYYKSRTGTLLEKDVFHALQFCSKGTPFENSISLVSGAAFPDIIAKKYYGVEVKSTISNHWKTIGSSILESTRNPDVERIFLTFGKLGDPVTFLSRPYEECLAGISVTHYPRYQIDMELKQGETIFDKIGISYDQLRTMENPVSPVSQYYKKRLKPGESLWWAADYTEETAAPPILRLWSSLSASEKNFFTIRGYVLFPEIFSSNPLIKYQRYTLWLVQNCSIVNSNVRDQFSAGGKINIRGVNNSMEKVPATFGRIIRYSKEIVREILTTEENILGKYWKVNKIQKDRIAQWIHLISNYAENKELTYEQISNVLYGILKP